VSEGGHLVLVGLMGAGKTTVGSECAVRLSRPFVDTDDLVVARTGMPVAEFFANYGEAAFREIERDVVADVCASPEPLVVACGGGTVVDPDSRRRLRAAGIVVWLRAPVGVLAERVGITPQSTRPLLAGDPVVVLGRLEAAREAAYEASAHLTVDTTDRDVDEVALAVLEAYERETERAT
jgi:shikimate kinase